VPRERVLLIKDEKDAITLLMRAIKEERKVFADGWRWSPYSTEAETLTPMAASSRAGPLLSVPNAKGAPEVGSWSSPDGQ